MNDTEQKLFDLQCIEAHTNQEIIDQIERLLGELKGRDRALNDKVEELEAHITTLYSG